MDNFEDVLNQHKEKARKVYADSGEGNLVNSAMREIESNCADYEYYFQMGQQSKQKRIDELQKNNDEVLKAIRSLSESLIREAKFYQDEVHISLFGRQLKRIHDDAKQALKGGEV